MIDFAEERLELGINYGAVGGMAFKTSIVETSDGREQRNAEWWLPLGRWQLGEKSLLESDEDKLHEVEYLRSFHGARKGSYEGFRFKDWSDYQATNQLIGVGDGQETEWQLKKTYYAGDAQTDRPITKPVEGTVILKLDDVEQAEGWGIDHTSGLVRFDNPVGTDVQITLDFEFDVPVIFEKDEISWQLEAYEPETQEAIYRLGSVFVQEIRVPVPKPLPILPIAAITEVLDLGIIYDSSEEIIYQTDKQPLASGWTRTDSNYSIPKTKLNLGDRILDREELEKLRGFFWCAKGKISKFLINFIDKQYLVNFSNDQLSLRFEGFHDAEIFFNLSSLNLIITSDFNFTLSIANSNPIYYGFTAASGAFTQDNQIISASFNSQTFIGNEPSLIPKQLNGQASYIGNGVRLNYGVDTEGSVFVINAVDLIALFNLSVYFHYQIDIGTSDRDYVADGIAFIIQASDGGTGTLTPGGGIGYAGTSNSVVVEFDTYLNTGTDQDNNHVGITINGNINTDPYTVNPGFDITGDRHCWITYQGGELQVYLAETSNKPTTPIVTRFIDWLEILAKDSI